MVTEGNLNNTINLNRPNVNTTCGGFGNEPEAQAWLVNFLSSCRSHNGQPFFKLIREQRRGVPLFRHHRQETDKNCRCDIIAIPHPPMCEMFGAIVFEVKCSGEPIGPGLNQLKDYMATAFDLGGIKVIPSFGFLFPCLKQHSATASWMAHQSIGSICQNEYDGHVRIFSGEERLIEFDRHGALLFATKAPRCGKGAGSR